MIAVPVSTLIAIIMFVFMMEIGGFSTLRARRILGLFGFVFN